MATRFISNRQIYEEAVQKLVNSARRWLWIAPADIKDMYVERNGAMIPFLQILADLLKRGIEIAADTRQGAGAGFPAGL